MLRFPSLLLCLTAFSGLTAPVAQAQSNDPDDFPVTVDRLDFDRTRADWIQVGVSLDVEPAPAGMEVLNPDFIDDVEVTVYLAFENPNAPAGSSDPSELFRFFEASSRIITMEARKKYVVYFFLPSEIRDRDELATDPYGCIAALSIGGRDLPIGKDNVAGKITAKSAGNFLEFARRNSAATEGQLLSLDDVPSWVILQTRIETDRIPPLYPPDR